MNRQWLAISVAGALGVGPLSADVKGQPFAGQAASAIIGHRLARFVFPVESENLVFQTRDRVLTAADGAYLEWRVSWSGDESRHGIDPDGIVIFRRWSELANRTIALRDVVLRAPIHVTTWCAPCTAPIETWRADSSVSVRVDRNRVIIEVRGRAGVQRVFPQMPDSVTFTRETESGERVEVVVPVRH